MRELRHTHCVFTDDFVIHRKWLTGYCAFCRMQGTDLLEVTAAEQYPKALELIALGKPRALCRDGKVRGVYTTAIPRAMPVKCMVKVGTVSVSGNVYWSELDNTLKFRANPQGNNYLLLREPEFGYEVVEYTSAWEPPVWKPHPHYVELWEEADEPKKRSEVSEMEWLAAQPGEILDDTETESVDFSSSDKVEDYDDLEDAP